MNHYILSIVLLAIAADAMAGCRLSMITGDYTSAIKSAQKEITSGSANASVYGCLGEAYYHTGKFSLAAEQFLKEASMVTSDADRSAAYQSIGMSMLYTGDYKKGIEYLNKKLAIDKKIGDKNEVGVSLATMAAIMGSMGKHQEAIDKSLEALNFLKHDTDIASTYNNIANEYAGMNDIESAIKYMMKAIEIDRKFLGNKKDLAIHLINISDFYLSQKKDKKAIESLNEGIQLIKKSGDLYWLMIALSYRSKAYFYVGEYKKSTNDIDQTLKIANEIKPREYNNIKALHANLTQAISNSNTNEPPASQ